MFAKVEVMKKNLLFFTHIIVDKSDERATKKFQKNNKKETSLQCHLGIISLGLGLCSLGQGKHKQIWFIYLGLSGCFVVLLFCSLFLSKVMSESSSLSFLTNENKIFNLIFSSLEDIIAILKEFQFNIKLFLIAFPSVRNVG